MPSPNRLDYSLYNFSDLVNQLQAIVVSQQAWIDINVESGTGNFLIELFAIVTEMMMYYLERRAQECYIDVAQLRSSLVSIVAILSYKPYRQRSAIGQVVFTVDDPNTTNGTHPYSILIPKGAVIQTDSGLSFFVINDTVLPANTLSVNVDVEEGVQGSVQYVSPGTASYQIVLPQTNVEDGSVAVTVSTAGHVVPWNSQLNFTFSTPSSLDFVQETQLDGTVLITLGDGNFGAIPATKAIITVSYVLTDGANGNVYSANVIHTLGSGTVIMDTAPIPQNVTSIMSVTNAVAVIGGDAEETIEQIRMNAPIVFKTGQRAVTREDFIAIINSIPDVMTSYAWGERDLNPPNYMMMNQIKIAALRSNWILPDTAFKTVIAKALANAEQLSIMLNFVDPDLIQTIVNVDVSVLPTYQVSAVLAAVQAAINAAFALGTVELGVPVYYARVLASIQDIQGVGYCHLAISFEASIGTGNGTLKAFTYTLDLLPVLDSTVQVLVNGVVVAADDGYNNITGPGISGYVDYTTGIITVNFTTAPVTGAVITVQYQQNQKGDIIVNMDQIAQLVETNINILT